MEGPAPMLSRACLLAAALVIAPVAHAAALPAPLPTVPLSINGHAITAEVAATPEQRSTGLMHRFSIRPDQGMLFVFERAEPQAFWMKNTFIPLSIAFIAQDGRIVNIDDMAPHDENLALVEGTGALRARNAQGLVRRARDPGRRRRHGPAGTEAMRRADPATS